MNQPPANGSRSPRAVGRGCACGPGARLAVATAVLFSLGLWLSTSIWTRAIGRSLICEDTRATSDAILIENFETEYFVFEQAAALRREGLSTRVLVPVQVDPTTGQLDEVSQAITGVMARTSRLGPYQAVPIQEIEPVSLNVARDVLRFLKRESLRSLLVVAPVFRSRRSALVYGAVLSPAGVSVRCVAARGTHSADDWTTSWHGIQNVLEQLVKLAYYRVYVLPSLSK